ncbi:MAG: outer membrane beta-barrel protein, partial [Luminiphilus sp.]
TFDTRQQETFAIPSWELRLAWTPDARSTLKVESQRLDRETTAGDDIIDTRSYGVNWTRRWNDQWSMQVAGTYLDEVYGRAHREQNTVQLNTAVHYAMQQRITWSLGYRWQDRDSNIEHLRLGQNRLEFRATIPI